MSFASQGSYLAVNRNSFWDPASSKSGYFVFYYFLLVYLRFTA